MKFDDLKKLHQRKYREQFAHFLLEGEHLVLELHKCMAQGEATKGLGRHVTSKDVSLYIHEERLAWASEHLPLFHPLVLSSKQMAQLSDTKTPQGVVACVPTFNDRKNKSSANKEWAEKERKDLPEQCFYLHEIQDPGNLGSIIRTLAWFGNFRLLISKNSVDLFNSKAVRASMGGIFHLPIERDVSIAELGARFSEFAYLDLAGKSVNQAHFASYPCYLFGNEARGVPVEELKRLNAQAYSIVGSGHIESLNVAMAASICAYRLSV